MAQTFISGIKGLRKSHGIMQSPVFVWEPEPRECSPQHVHHIIETAKMVDFVSPNHLKLLKMFNVSLASGTEDLKTSIQQAAREFHTTGTGRQGNPIVIVRASDLGCMIQSTAREPTWFPPFYESSGSPRSTETVSHSAIRHPTGAGNAFLDAFGAEITRSGDEFLAIAHGTIAASFVVEQTGLPKTGEKLLKNER